MSFRRKRGECNLLSVRPTVENDVVLHNVQLGSYTQIKAHSILEETQMDDYSYCAGYNQIYAANIGRFCSIATFVRINPGNHPCYTRAAQHHFTYRCSMFGFGEDDEAFFKARTDNKVTLGHDVWLGHNVTVMPGVTIGSGAAVGSGAVVTKDVEPYAVVVGAPAKKIRMRFSDTIIEGIESTRWWEWSHDILRKRLPDFSNIELFISKYSNV